LQFGDEGELEKYTFEFRSHRGLTDLDAEEEKAMQAEIKDKFKPLLSWWKSQAEGIVRDGSHRVDLSFPLSDLLSSRYL
jgi:hypothetical protein